MIEKAALELLRYDPCTGLFHWLDIPRPGMHSCGKVAGRKVKGYVHIKVCQRTVSAHRLAWFFHHGKWPTKEIDHINGVRDDNRISNLREATHRQQQQNVKLRKDSSSGFTGVSWSKAANRWAARIKHKGVERHLGTYPSANEAYQAYLQAKRDIHEFQPVPRGLLEHHPTDKNLVRVKAQQENGE